MLKLRISLFLAASLLSAGAIADVGAFQVLAQGDAPQGECGTYVHGSGDEPGPTTTRLFMTNDRTLFLKTAAGVRKLEFERVDKQLRVKNVLGRGDTLTFRFKAPGKERAVLGGTVTEAVVDDRGDYPLVALTSRVSYTSPAGLRLEASDLVAHDMCM